MPGDSGIDRSNVVCFVVCAEGEVKAGSYARRGNAPPVRTADGALGRENEAPGFGDAGNETPLGEAGKVVPGAGDVGKVAPGLGEAGREGKRLTPGLGEDGSPTKGAVERSVIADSGSCSEFA